MTLLLHSFSKLKQKQVGYKEVMVSHTSDLTP